MRNQAVEYWSLDDYDAQRCNIHDIGTPKIKGVDPMVTVTITETVPPTVPEVAAEKPYSERDFLRSLQQVRMAIVNAILEYPGGPVKWMHDHPGGHQRLIAKLVGGQLDQKTETFIKIDIPWLKPERLSYKYNPLDETVIDARPSFDRTLVDDIDPNAKD